jgi:hypothetical protein
MSGVFDRDDLVDPLGRPLDLAGLVGNDVVVVVLASQLDRGITLADLELLGRLGGASSEPLEQLLERRWDHEDQQRLRDLLLDDLRALDVDLEDDVPARDEGVSNLFARRAVPVAVDLIRLEEAAGRAEAEELLAAEELVVDAVDLAVSGRTGRARDDVMTLRLADPAVGARR